MISKEGSNELGAYGFPALISFYLFIPKNQKKYSFIPLTLIIIENWIVCFDE